MADIDTEKICQAIGIVQKIITVVEDILPALQQIALSLKKFFIHSSTTAAITTKFRDLQQLVRESLIQLKGGFFNTCKSLATYGADETVHSRIVEDLSQTDSERENLKEFAHICNEKFNAAVNSYLEFCNISARLLKQLTAAMNEGFDIQDKKQRRSIVRKIAYSVGGIGIATVVGAGAVALSPIVVPASIVGAAAFFGGAAGIGGIVSGALVQKLEPISDIDIKVLTQSIEGLEELKGMLRRARVEAVKGRTGPIKASIGDMKARSFIKTEKGAMLSEDSQDDFSRSAHTDYIKCIPLDDEELKRVKKETVVDVLKAFKDEMKKLLDMTEKALIAIDKDLESIDASQE